MGTKRDDDASADLADRNVPEEDRSGTKALGNPRCSLTEAELLEEFARADSISARFGCGPTTAGTAAQGC